MSNAASSTPNARPANRIWVFLQILNVRLRFIVLMVLVGVISANWENLMNQYDRWQRPPKSAGKAMSSSTEYFCPMHPNIVRSEPSNCPICGMPLSKRDQTGHQQMPPDALARIQLSPFKVHMGRIATSSVEYRLLGREIRTVGVINYDETRRAFIPARFKGRIDQLFVNYVGQRVEKGAPLVSIFSPDLVVAQQEYLSALERVEEAKTSAPVVRSNADRLLAAARQKLVLWGIEPEQIDELRQRGTVETSLTLRSPISGIVTEKKVLEGHYVNEGEDLYTIADLSTVWAQSNVFADEIADVPLGTAVVVTSDVDSSELFAGRIAFIAYSVDPGTRTVSARVEVANPDLRLRPGMYVRATIQLPAGKVESIDPQTTQQSIPLADTRSVVEAYLAISKSYALDKPDDAAVDVLLEKSRGLLTAETTAMRDNGKALIDAIAAMRGKDFRAQREQFKQVSALLIAIVRDVPPADLVVSTFNCPMAKADWLGLGEDVRNPYYGSEMLECGKVTGRIEAKMSQDHERFATGYYCPAYPDRLFERPQHCPVDKFPLKYSRVEKVLSVPETAVINTGTRRIAYRESEPGVFDMVEVKLGPRAGEFYPVLSGLAPGDRVATRGAFLVDAENRLNPAAAAQYFGAAGDTAK